jgi:hypothetical protein
MAWYEHGRPRAPEGSGSANCHTEVECCDNPDHHEKTGSVAIDRGQVHIQMHFPHGHNPKI